MDSNTVIPVIISLVLAFLYPLLLSDQNDTQIRLSPDGQDLKQEWHLDNVILWAVTFGVVSNLVYDLTWAAVAYIFMARAWHWIAFDASLNYRRGLAWDYVSAAPDAAQSDKLLLRLHKWQYPLKFGLLIFCLTFYVLFLCIDC